MTRSVSVAEAKSHLSEFLSRVGYGAERFIIERHGKPVGALVSPEDLRKLDAQPQPKLRGLLAAYGGSESIDGVDDLFDDVVKSRVTSLDREVELG